MEFKGTKGKWEYKVIYGKKRPKITVQIPVKEDYNQVLVLGTIGEDYCTVASCCCQKEHANALLISKAPEMLEALKTVIRLRDLIDYDESIVNESNIGEASALNQMLKRIDSLIKEATEL